MCAFWQQSQGSQTHAESKLRTTCTQVCNAYTELNDPQRQRELFADQAGASAEGEFSAFASSKLLRGLHTFQI